MTKGKVVAIDNKKKETGKEIDALGQAWRKYIDGAYDRAGLQIAVQRIVAAAEEMLKSLDGIPFGFTNDEIAPNAIRVKDIYELALALDPGIGRWLNITDNLENDFEPSNEDRLAYFKWVELCDGHDTARFDTSDAAFQVGIIFGAHLVGASAEQITRLTKGLIRHRTCTTPALRKSDR